MSEFLTASPAEKTLPTKKRFSEFVRNHLHTRENTENKYMRFGVYHAEFDSNLPASQVIFARHIEHRGIGIFSTCDVIYVNTPIAFSIENDVATQIIRTRISSTTEGWYVDGSELTTQEIDAPAFANHLLDTLEFLEITGGLNPVVPSDRTNFVYP